MDKKIPSAVTVFAGRRDGYQVPWALNEQGLLEKHVADVYSGGAIMSLAGKLKENLKELRTCPGLPRDKVEWTLSAAVMSYACKLLPSHRNRIFPVRDNRLSLRAARLAIDTDAVYFPYSYYAGEGIARYGRQTRANIIFQVHPLGGYLRKIYAHDMELQPAGRNSLLAEEEFRQKGRFQELIEEAPHGASGIICASSLTKTSLISAGVKCPIHVVPYGVSLDKFTMRTAPPASGRLRLAFVGQLSQRKGILHLIEGIRASGVDTELVIISRGKLREEFMPLLSKIRYVHHAGLGDEAAWNIVKSCHYLALPSVAEGFGLVILEAFACGVPVIASTNTGAFDVMRHGQEGFLVSPGDSQGIAQAIYSAAYPGVSWEMGLKARRAAESCTWQSFRENIARSYYALVTN